MRKIISLMLAVLLVCSLVMPAGVVLAADTDILYNTQTTWFPINESTGANAKLFMLKDGTEYNLGESYNDYVYGLDYDGSLTYNESKGANIATGTSADEPTDMSKKIGAIVYTVDQTDVTGQWTNIPGVNLTTKDGAKYWNILNKDYLITPEEKVIKLYTNVDASGCEDEALAARFETLNQVTFDIPDGQYQNIGFLASASWDRNLYVELTYKDGTKSARKTIEIPRSGKLAEEGFGQAKGYICLSQAKTHGYNAARVFRPYTIEADVTKTLDKITLKSSYRVDPIFVIASWGEKPSFEARLAKVTDVKELTEDNIEDAQAEIEAFMEYVEACGLTYNDLDAEMKAKVDTIRTPYAQILANKLEKLDENAVITADNIYDYKDILEDAEAYRVANSLEYTSEQSAKIETVTANIEAVEYDIIAADVNARIEELPEIDTVTVDNFEEISLKVQEIKALITNNSIASEDILSQNQTYLAEMQAKLDVVILDVKKLVPLDIQDGANTKLFIENGRTDPDYKEWSEYIAGSWFSSVSADTKWNGKAIRYSNEGPEAVGVVYAPNNIWTLNGVPLAIGSDKLGIRLHGARKVNYNNDELAEIMAAYTTTTINLEKGLYSKIYIPASNHMGSGNTEATKYTKLSYVLTYMDGSTQEGEFNVHYSPTPDKYFPSAGYVETNSVDPDVVSKSIIRFAIYEIEVDPAKQVDTLKLSNSDTSRIVYIPGIGAETAKIGDVKTLIEEKLNYSIPSVGTASEATLLELEDLINEYKSAGGDVNSFENIEKFNADIEAYYKDVIELEGTKYDVDFENTYFEAEYSKNVDLTDVVISVTKNGAAVDAKDCTVTAEDNKIKITINDKHEKAAEYKISIGTGVKNISNANFYVNEIYEETFEARKAIEITKFDLADGTISFSAINNMQEAAQDYVLVIAAYDADNKLVGSREVKGNLKAGKTAEAALDASAFETGVKVECFLFDNIDSIKYLDTVNAIAIAE